MSAGVQKTFTHSDDPKFRKGKIVETAPPKESKNKRQKKTEINRFEDFYN